MTLLVGIGLIFGMAFVPAVILAVIMTANPPR